jgi:hypothetical protein
VEEASYESTRLPAHHRRTPIPALPALTGVGDECVGDEGVCKSVYIVYEKDYLGEEHAHRNLAWTVGSTSSQHRPCVHGGTYRGKLLKFAPKQGFRTLTISLFPSQQPLPEISISFIPGTEHTVSRHATWHACAARCRSLDPESFASVGRELAGQGRPILPTTHEIRAARCRSLDPESFGSVGRELARQARPILPTRSVAHCSVLARQFCLSIGAIDHSMLLHSLHLCRSWLISAGQPLGNKLAIKMSFHTGTEIRHPQRQNHNRICPSLFRDAY